jgi:hypothetical protein
VKQGLQDADVSGVRSAVSAFFASRPEGLVAAYLYGSFARGDARPDSDVDVAVLQATPPPPTYQGLPLAVESDLERALGRPTQVVSLHQAPLDLVHEILRDGILVLETDRAARVSFEVRARNEYFDLLPMLERYRRLPVPVR